MRIGEVAKRSGVAASAIRYYERAGVLRPGRRTRSGYRDYGDDVIAQLTFVARAKECGFALPEIKMLIAGGHSGDVDVLVSQKLAAISAQRRSLQLVEVRLQMLRAKGRIARGTKLRQMFDEDVTMAEPSMQETPRMDRALLTEAAAEAIGLRHGWIGAEHVLLALLNRKNHPASELLHNSRLTARDARKDVVALLGRGKTAVTEVSLTPRVQRMLGIVHGLSGHRTRKTLTTHWLLALIDAGESVGTGVMERGGVDLAKLRAHLIDLMDTG